MTGDNITSAFDRRVWTVRMLKEIIENIQDGALTVQSCNLEVGVHDVELTFRAARGAPRVK